MAGPLSTLERVLAAVIEGATERVFTRRVQPLHIAQRLERAMEEGTLVGTQGTLAPNYFAVQLDPATHQRFAGAVDGLQADLERHLAAAAARRRLRFLDPVLVDLHPDPALGRNRFRVRASFTRGEGEASPHAPAPPPAWVNAEQTMTMPALHTEPPRPVSQPGLARLEVRAVAGAVHEVALEAPACTIGRADDNDVVLDEVAVSRYHATVRREGERYLVQDTGSANGVLVNGRRVKSAPLRDGDRLLIGTTELVFRRS